MGLSAVAEQKLEEKRGSFSSPTSPSSISLLEMAPEASTLVVENMHGGFVHLYACLVTQTLFYYIPFLPKFPGEIL